MRKRPHSTTKTRLPLIAGALFFIGMPFGAQAQVSADATQLMSRINQLETQIQTMSRVVYRGEKAEMPADFNAGGTSSNAVAAYESRMVQIEEQQRNLTGQIEKIGYDVQQLKSQVERMQADTDQRFSQMNKAPTHASSSSPSEADSPSDVSMPAPGKSSADEIYDRAFAAIREAKYEAAENDFKQFLRDYPSHTLAANAQYWLGETHYVRGDFKQAAQVFAQGYQDFPKSPKAADSLLKLGLSLSKLGRKEDACLSLKQLQKDFKGEAATLQTRAVQEIKQLSCP